MSRIRFFRQGVAIATFGALASVGCFVVDDTDDDDDGDNGGEAGESTGGSSRGGSSTGGRGGTNPTGGSEAGGSENGGSSSGGSGPAGGSDSGGSSTGGSDGGSTTGGAAPTGGTGPGGEAVMKFCNELYKNDEPAPLTVLFAGVRATAVSGTCTPVVPDPCIPIPAGSAPTVALLDGTTEIVSGSFPELVIADGDEIIVLATVTDSATPVPTAQAGPFPTGYVCSETDPFGPPPEMLETKSAPFSLPIERNLRSELRPAATTWAKKRAAF
jgi:hypothetical protein